MRNIIPLVLSFVVLFSCKSGKGPDVSDIKVDLELQRFETDFFAIDTNNILPSLQQLHGKYPGFLPDYLQNILGLPPVSDTSVEVPSAIRKFISDYRPVKDSADKIFNDIDHIRDEVIKGLKHVKYYFPNYAVPRKLITFIGPMDAYFEAALGGYGDVITTDALAVGLQLHMGNNFSLYRSEIGQSLYPVYISRRFTPDYIPVNCIKNIIDDLYPDESPGKHLVIQMVEKGKRMHLLNLLMPYTPDTLKIGYTDSQLKGCYSNEGLIWNYFLANGLLYNNDPSIIKNYIGESPNTPEFGEGAPGNIGLFIGWQIVKEYLEKNSKLTPDALMKTDSKRIFEESKYRPK